MAVHEILWKPGKDFIDNLEFIRFQNYIEDKFHHKFSDYEEFRSWTIGNIEEFWKSILEYFNVIFEGNAEKVLTSYSMPGQKWFPQITLNYAENILLREKLSGDTIIGIQENGEQRKIKSEELLGKVGAFSRSLKDLGIERGDRVAAILPNVPEAIIASLATASIGAIWSCSSPDFGPQGILDRFSQIEPRVLIAVDGYRYNNKIFDKREQIREIREKIHTIENVIVLENIGLSLDSDHYDMTSFLKDHKTPEFTRVGFNDPLWILYSSGTTGPPKAIVHGHGNILLEHLKLLKIHYNVSRGKKFFWYTTTGWMMWNVLLSSIGTGATAITYDGSATYPDDYHLWKIADELGLSFFGTSAAFLTYCMKKNLKINEKFQLEPLYAIGSTGSPLPPEAFRYVYSNIKNNVWLASISGGTDVCTAFLGGCPTLPVNEGELQCINLGADIHSFNDYGSEVKGETGELVIIKPYISMPVFLWKDMNFSKYRETYLDKFPGIWNHGDWIEITERGTVIIYGRSDATLKRRGIRIGTAEIYRVVEKIPEVNDSLIIGVEMKGGEYYMPLFIVASNEADKEGLRKRINEKIREELSPRHVPDEIIFVKDVPKTINGKKMEVPVKKLFIGIPPDKALNLSSMANPWCIDEYIKLSKQIRDKLENNL